MAVPRLQPTRRVPRYSTSPDVGAISPAMQRKSVDFPLPLRPSSATNSESATSRSTPSSTGMGWAPAPANDLVT